MVQKIILSLKMFSKPTLSIRRMLLTS